MVNLIKLIFERPYPGDMEPDVRVIHTTEKLEERITTDYLKMGWAVTCREEI